MLRRRSKALSAAMNITPLIDVVFILLVFFMIATNFQRIKLIGVDTPKETEVVRDSEGAIVVLLKSDGGLAFDGEDIAPDALGGAVTDVVAIDPARGFLVRPEEGVSLQSAITVFDFVRASGARSVSFSGPKPENG
ncbi:MAG: ExbD/TolR family protein [Maricaulaceae bacterium]